MYYRVKRKEKWQILGSGQKVENIVEYEESCSWDDIHMAKQRKPKERNLISINSSTKWRYKNQLCQIKNRW